MLFVVLYPPAILELSQSRESELFDEEGHLFHRLVEDEQYFYGLVSVRTAKDQPGQ